MITYGQRVVEELKSYGFNDLDEELVRECVDKATTDAVVAEHKRIIAWIKEVPDSWLRENNGGQNFNFNAVKQIFIATVKGISGG